MSTKTLVMSVAILVLVNTPVTQSSIPLLPRVLFGTASLPLAGGQHESPYHPRQHRQPRHAGGAAALPTELDRHPLAAQGRREVAPYRPDLGRGGGQRPGRCIQPRGQGAD